MKKFFNNYGVVFASLVSCALYADSSSPRRWVVNTIVGRVDGGNILLSDLEEFRISTEGGMSSPHEHYLEECYVQEASQKQLLPSDADINRQILGFKTQAGIQTDEELEQELKSSGLTVAKYKNQLGRLIAIENLKRAEIMDKIVVTSQDVEKYWSDNPEYEPESYHIHLAILSPHQVSKLDDGLLIPDECDWVDLGWVERESLDPKYEQILSIDVNKISSPIKVDDTYHVVKISAKKQKMLRSLDERYQDIETTLRERKRDHELVEFEKNLIKKHPFSSLI